MERCLGRCAGGLPGYVACVGMSSAWDAVLPSMQYAYTVTKESTLAALTLDKQRFQRSGDATSLRYNLQQVRTDLNGCNHGAATP